MDSGRSFYIYWVISAQGEGKKILNKEHEALADHIYYGLRYTYKIWSGIKQSFIGFINVRYVTKAKNEAERKRIMMKLNKVGLETYLKERNQDA